MAKSEHKPLQSMGLPRYEPGHLEQEPPRQVVTISIDVGDLTPRINQGILTLDLPGQPIGTQMVKELIETLGLTGREQDRLVDETLDFLRHQTAILALTKRLR